MSLMTLASTIPVRSQLVYSIECRGENMSSVAVCQKSATWMPDPMEYVCSSNSLLTVSPDVIEHSKIEIMTHLILSCIYVP